MKAHIEEEELIVIRLKKLPWYRYRFSRFTLFLLIIYLPYFLFPQLTMSEIEVEEPEQTKFIVEYFLWGMIPVIILWFWLRISLRTYISETGVYYTRKQALNLLNYGPYCTLDTNNENSSDVS